MRPQAVQRRRAIAIVGRALCLEIVEADQARGVGRAIVEVPARLGERWRSVTASASFGVEEFLTALRRCRIEASLGRCRSGKRELIRLERCQFGSDQISLTRRRRNVVEVIGGGNGKLRRIPQPRVLEPANAVHLQIGNKSVPMWDRTPSSPGVQIYSGQTE